MRVWDAVTGQPVGSPLGHHPGRVTAVVLDRAGNRDVIVSGSGDRTVRVWDAASRQPVGSPLTGHVGRVTSVAVNGAVIVSGGEDGTVLVWDEVTGQPVGSPLTGHVGRVTSVAVNGAVIVSGGEDGTVLVWDMETRQPVARQQFPDGLWSLALTGERLVVAQGNDVMALRPNPTIKQVTGFAVSQRECHDRDHRGARVAKLGLQPANRPKRYLPSDLSIGPQLQGEREPSLSRRAGPGIWLAGDYILVSEPVSWTRCEARDRPSREIDRKEGESVERAEGRGRAIGGADRAAGRAVWQPGRRARVKAAACVSGFPSRSN